jgi:hypothetical protein
MNAQTKVTAAAPARDRYRPIVTHHLAGCSGKELGLRCSILLMRDMATSKQRDCSEEAYGILGQISRLATRYAFEIMPVEELESLRYALLRLTAVASDLEQFVYRLEYPGGSDAGG